MLARSATDSFKQFLTVTEPLDFNFINKEEITLSFTVTYPTASGGIISEDIVIHFVPTVTYFKGSFV